MTSYSTEKGFCPRCGCANGNHIKDRCHGWDRRKKQPSVQCTTQWSRCTTGAHGTARRIDCVRCHNHPGAAPDLFFNLNRVKTADQIDLPWPDDDETDLGDEPVNTTIRDPQDSWDSNSNTEIETGEHSNESYYSQDNYTRNEVRYMSETQPASVTSSDPLSWSQERIQREQDAAATATDDPVGNLTENLEDTHIDEKQADNDIHYNYTNYGNAEDGYADDDNPDDHNPDDHNSKDSYSEDGFADDAYSDNDNVYDDNVNDGDNFYQGYTDNDNTNDDNADGDNYAENAKIDIHVETYCSGTRICFSNPEGRKLVTARESWVKEYKQYKDESLRCFVYTSAASGRRYYSWELPKAHPKAESSRAAEGVKSGSSSKHGKGKESGSSSTHGKGKESSSSSKHGKGKESSSSSKHGKGKESGSSSKNGKGKERA